MPALTFCSSSYLQLLLLGFEPHKGFLSLPLCLRPEGKSRTELRSQLHSCLPFGLISRYDRHGLLPAWCRQQRPLGRPRLRASGGAFMREAQRVPGAFAALATAAAAPCCARPPLLATRQPENALYWGRVLHFRPLVTTARMDLLQFGHVQLACFAPGFARS